MPTREFVLLLSLGFLFMVMIGTVMQYLVVTNNGGKMPVKVDEYYIPSFESDEHFSFENDSEVEYPYLTDRIKINHLYKSKKYHISPGDFLVIGFGIALCISIIIYLIMLWRSREIIRNPVSRY